MGQLASSLTSIEVRDERKGLLKEILDKTQTVAADKHCHAAVGEKRGEDIFSASWEVNQQREPTAEQLKDGSGLSDSAQQL